MCTQYLPVFIAGTTPPDNTPTVSSKVMPFLPIGYGRYWMENPSKNGNITCCTYAYPGTYITVYLRVCILNTCNKLPAWVPGYGGYTRMSSSTQVLSAYMHNLYTGLIVMLLFLTIKKKWWGSLNIKVLFLTSHVQYVVDIRGTGSICFVACTGTTQVTYARKDTR